ncbi:hypothetical protein POJ06DRAFT_271791 [Lipomyces tetrasporus]|uniref:Uncharacterized protein n=1 Tax=Lipomyces tetrasporus TaxID=54092 RepID=A0AAD7QMR6_9ASCO|nr:uncharacterized protein POJ06DRAFT_271791 [Lipomyces tetrasporus]KAJ8096767.1 hypothetical protein POJ06DRAFT_271791 [Lipomyces tetrasporus]
MVLTRVKPSLYMAGFTVTWSLLSWHSVFAFNLLHKKEIFLRIALFYTGNIAANTFCRLFAAAIFATLDGVHHRILSRLELAYSVS